MNEKRKLTIADIDAALGIKPKGETAKEKAYKLLNRVYHQRNSTGDFADEIAFANGTARRWQFGQNNPAWEPVSRVTIIHTQHCACCHSSVDYIANEFTEFENKNLRAKVLSPRLEAEKKLPHRIEEFHLRVEQCANCARIASSAFEFSGDEPGIAPVQPSIFPSLQEEFIQ